MSEVTVEAGSGLVATFRKFGVREENLASGKAAQREGRVKTRLLQAVTLHVDDFGPYSRERDGSLDWEKVLHGDREIVFRDLRVGTWGPDYFRDDPCPSCDEPTKNTFDLRKFPVQKLPESSVEHVKSGKPLECKLPECGKRVTFRLRRGSDEKDLRRIAQLKEEELSSEFLRLHVLEVEGVEAQALPAFLAALEGNDGPYLRWAIDAADTGIDQHGTWACQCGKKWTQDVDFGRDFFFPSWRPRTN